MAKRLKVTLMKSLSGRLPGHRACIRGLGLRRRHQSVELPDDPRIRGMIRKVAYMLKVEEL